MEKKFKLRILIFKTEQTQLKPQIDIMKWKMAKSKGREEGEKNK